MPQNYSFTTHSKTGKGRGKFLGFPTVNVIIPERLSVTIAEGIYAARATLKGATYKTALYYGSVPTFDDAEKTLELFLIDAVDVNVAQGEEVAVEVIKFIRPVKKYDTPVQLVLQMRRDVADIKEILQ